ncbi:MAG: IS200/IS605 family transposase [Akkermansia sp.]|nr:IS200/IS605 family transposase [Akkermansia sp.]
MAHTFTNAIFHIIFHTKRNSCVMKEEDLSRIFQYIGGIAREMSGYLYKVGGRPDHIHLLTPLPITSSLSDFVRIIKTNSSKWIKGLDEAYKEFAWQEGYGAFSVSESNKHAVMQYIEKQPEHHKNRTSEEEFDMFLAKNGYIRDRQSGIIKKHEE